MKSPLSSRPTVSKQAAEIILLGGNFLRLSLAHEKGVRGMKENPKPSEKILFPSL